MTLPPQKNMPVTPLIMGNLTHKKVQKKIKQTKSKLEQDPGGYSSMIWVGTCRWDLKSRPIFIPNFAENEIHFYTRAQILSKIYLKCHNIFQNCEAFKQISEILVSDWWNWAYVRANLRKFWRYDSCLNQFLHWIRGHRYTRRLILRPILAARPRIDLCTKNPPPPRGTRASTYYSETGQGLQQVLYQRFSLALKR